VADGSGMAREKAGEVRAPGGGKGGMKTEYTLSGRVEEFLARDRKEKRDPGQAIRRRAGVANSSVRTGEGRSRSLPVKKA